MSSVNYPGRGLPGGQMIKLYGLDNKEMMAINTLDRQADGKALIIKGKIYGAMPVTALLYPEDVRALLKMLRPRLIWFLMVMALQSARNKR